MLNCLKEMFLTEYYLYRVLLDGIADCKVIYNQLADIFLLTKEQAEELYICAEDETVRDIRDERDYMQFCREQTYFEMTGIAEVSPLLDIVGIKGRAINTLKEIGCLTESEQTQAAIIKKLSNAASEGKVVAMRMMGLMYCGGYAVQTNETQGIKYIKHASDWNNVEALFMSLYYGKDETANRLAALEYLLKNTANEALDAVVGKYGGANTDSSPEVHLLEKLFRLGLFKRECYSAPCARTLFSGVICFKDKEKLLFSGSGDSLALAGDLPLKLGANCDDFEFDFNKLDELPVNRGRERQDVMRALVNSDLRSQPAYRPACFYSKSTYMTALYASAIGSVIQNCHVVSVNVAELNECDFDLTKNNIFVRDCDEDRNNLYRLFFQGEINPRKMEIVKSFLKSANRRNFHLNSPSLGIDLSAILPVCFCDSKNVDSLRQICDVYQIDDASVEEKTQILQHILRKKEITYGIPQIEADDEATEKLLAFSVDEMERRLDQIIRFHRQKGCKLSLTLSMLQVGGAISPRRFGFGGFTNEIK